MCDKIIACKRKTTFCIFSSILYVLLDAVSDIFSFFITKLSALYIVRHNLTHGSKIRSLVFHIYYCCKPVCMRRYRLIIMSSNFYFNRLPRLWNSLPPIDLTLSSSTIKSKIIKYFWHHFNSHFRSDNPCSFHFFCPCAKFKLTCVNFCIRNS